MLLKILDALVCPECTGASRLWRMKGDITDLRIADGVVICPQDHKWQVREEILRLDKQESEEDMIFLDHDFTGFPKEVGELERGQFLMTIEDFFEKVQFHTQMIVIYGSPILFFKYLFPKNIKYVTVHPNEGILRQLQVMAVQKQVYPRTSFIRAERVDFLGDKKNIHVFTDVDLKELNPGDMAIRFRQLNTELTGREIWKGLTHYLEFITK